MAFQTIRFLLLLTLAFLAAMSKTQAQTPGTLDNTFAGTGATTIDFSSVYQSDDVGRSTLVLPDGKILAGGITENNGVILMRLNTNGSTDLSFGDNGSTVVRQFNRLNKLAVQSDGKIIAVGRGANGLNVYRFTSNGLIDSTFGGGDGVFTYLPQVVGADLGAEAFDVAVQPDNKIVVVGYSSIQTVSPPPPSPPTTQTRTEDQLIIRLNANGTLDNTFNGTGIQTIFRNSASGPPSNFIIFQPTQALSVALQSDGKIVVGGLRGAVLSQSPPIAHSNITLARFLASGALDNTFSGDGLAEFNLRSATIQGVPAASNESAKDIEILPDGRILILTTTQDTVRQGPTVNLALGIGLVRVTANGNLDATFGNGGMRVVASRDIRPMAMARATQGRIYLAGLEREVFANDYAPVLIRVDSVGALDSSFNGTGSIRITQSLLPSNSDLILDFALQSDGKPLLLGNNGGKSIAAIRLNANGSFDNSFNGNGIRIFNNPNPKTDDTPQSIAIAPDGKIAIAGNAGNYLIAISLLNANGTPVASFGNNGKSLIQITSSVAFSGAMAVQHDGRILLTTPSRLRRFRTNGLVDSAFGSSGTRVIGDVIAPEKIIALNNGKILLVGTQNNRAQLAMLNANGSNDNAFGSNGVATVIFGTNAVFRDALFLNDGKILALGTATINNVPQILLARFNSNGALDSSFSGDGIATIANLNANATCAFVQGDGKCVVGGSLGQQAQPSAFVARFLANGDLDTTFGMNQDSTFFRKGVARIVLANTSGGIANALFVEGDGKLLITMRASDGAVIVRARENGRSVANNAIDSTFATNGIARYVMPSGTTFQSNYCVATQPDGRVLLAAQTTGSNNTKDFWVGRVFNSVRFGASISGGQTGQIVLGGSGATVNITGNTGSGGSITATVGVNPNTVGALPQGVNQVLRDRYWTITTNATGLTYNLTLDLSGMSGIRNFNLLRVLRRNDSLSQWQDVSRPPINASVSYNAPFITVSGLRSFSDFAIGQDSTTQLSANDAPAKPKSFALGQNYPNPFNPTTVIPYELPVASDVRVEAFDVLGRKIATLANTREEAGYHSVTLHASSLGLTSGVYFYRIQAGQFVATKKMLLVK
ncbi:MAG: T9SS type A sorting domain-containing protein [Chloroherpetonaceae bacterium]|nr:T9SS type A sorting domain-containing protein [Chloroherpetonaceae bacterium]